MRAALATACALGAAVATILFALSIGTTAIPPRDVLAALFHPSGDMNARIVQELRLPRVCIAALVGAVLGSAGTLLQTLTRNPLVDPYITGVSAGAGLAIALGLAAGIPIVALPALGFVSGLIAALAVVRLSLHAGSIDPQRLILAGIFLSAFLSAIVTITLTRMQPGGAATAIITWLAGSLAGRGWPEVRWSLPYAAAGFALAALTVPELNVLRLGEQHARSLGVAVGRTQGMVVLAAVLLTATAVALSGMVGFVGLLAPYVARRLVGDDARATLPFSALIGIIIVVAADAAARTLAQPGELPIGALLAILGVPFFFIILSRENARRFSS